MGPSAAGCCCASLPIEPGVHDSGGGTLEEGVISLEGERREACIVLLYWIFSAVLPTPPFDNVNSADSQGCFSPLQNRGRL